MGIYINTKRGKTFRIGKSTRKKAEVGKREAYVGKGREKSGEKNLSKNFPLLLREIMLNMCFVGQDGELGLDLII